jgi:ABC-type glycerol-3-phosphate transport system substrate-binding protein
LKGSDPAKIAAAWKYAQYLTTPTAQATWAAGTGYIPISKQSVQSQVMQELWSSKPGYKVAYDQLATGANNEATAGPVIGDYLGVREAIKNALESFLVGSSDPDSAMASAVKKADAAIKAYNDRVG